MNTEQAIKLFSDILEDKGQIKNLRYINPKHIECAIEALRAQQEREKGCPCCNISEPIIDEQKCTAWEDDGRLWVDYQYEPRVSSQIYFCPMCGRPLEPKEAR